ncbi:hypothetical protein [Kribbella sp. CA-293567]|uniref:hypothetical protein n=1 Tax=Kribbella sp. CA-293567 TaxID=3002436 RepID=UPI0022DE5FBE|nr:hypothetical protein [Kribbella sp. CA-293567]WBQ04918.1 hypothetical protein OX958_33820 [Kribbella sp. CA-293567]
MRKLLSGVRPNRRQVFLAGAVAAASTVATTGTAAAGGYGSGDLGAWKHLTKAIAPAATIQRVLAANGVFMFGDSIGVQDGKALSIRLMNTLSLDLAVNNWSGRPTKETVDELANWKAAYGLPRRVVMSCGTNDVFTPPAMAGQIDRAMSIVGSRTTVFWVNTQVARPGLGATVQLADQRNSAWVNLQLADAQRRYPNLRIVRWAEWLAAKPTRLGTYVRGGIHTSVPYGQDARNELIVQAIKAG